ncbi:hypothetical protein EGM70_17565 [Enterobacteriaceae bacterium 89]|nr:hypothetical protein [Enterobacteriaceae bacterium 89]
MRNKLKEMLEEARELRSLGAMDDEGVQKIEGLVEASEQKANCPAALRLRGPTKQDAVDVVGRVRRSRTRH